MIPYSRQTIEQADIDAVVGALQSGWLTTGPQVEAFEDAVGETVVAEHTVAVNSGTAALHCLLAGCDIGPGDEVLVPAISFVATANAALYVGARPVFVDVDPHSMLLDPAAAAAAITPRTKAILAVDFAGQPCRYDELQPLCQRHRLYLFADSCHALGAKLQGHTIPQWTDACVYSFHPVKPLTTAEGGMVATQSAELARRVRCLRNHGLDSDHRQREQQATWYYDMVKLGFNYRISDLQCALGNAQLARLPVWQAKRNALANEYRQFLSRWPHGEPQAVAADVEHAYHLMVLQLAPDAPFDREQAFRQLRAMGIGVNVHYRPIYLHSYYRRRFGLNPGTCPVAESVAARLLSLPLYPGLTPDELTHTFRSLDSLEISAAA